MDNQQRSWNLLLFLLPQAARNVREVLRSARASVPESAPIEEKATFALQEDLLGKFYKAIEVMSHDGWEFADERLEDLIAECEELRRTSARQSNDESIEEFRSKLDEAFLRAADNPRSSEAISKALEGVDPTPTDGEDQNGEEK